MEARGMQEMRDWANETYPYDGDQYLLTLREILGLQDVVMSQLVNTKESGGFKITLVEVSDDIGPELSRCHSSLLDAILEAAFGYTHLGDLEQFINAGILKWLNTVQGIRFLNMHLDVDHVYYLMDPDFYDALLYTWAHWRENTMGPRTLLAVFNHIKSTCGIDLAIDGLEVRVDKIGTWEQDGASKHEQREKRFNVIFSEKEGRDGFIQSVTFDLERTRVNKSLQDLAAEAFARQMKTRGDIERLDVATKTQTRNAKNLVDKVLEKFKDVEWIKAHEELTTKQWKEMYEKEKEKNVTAEKTIKKLEEQQQKAAERMEEELGDSQHVAKVKSLEKELARLQEQVTQLKAAEQMNAVVSKEQQEALEEQREVEEQPFQPREAEQHQKQVAQLGNKIKGKQGAMEELRDANQFLTLAAAMTEEEEALT